MRSTSFDPFAVTFENGRDGQKAGRLFISGCIDRDGGWQIEHNSRILLILLSLFSKEEWRCVLFQFMKGRTLFRIYYWSLSESAICVWLKTIHKRWAAKSNKNCLSNLRKIPKKWKVKSFHFLYFEFIHLANNKIILTLFQIPYSKFQRMWFCKIQSLLLKCPRPSNISQELLIYFFSI